MTCLLPHLVGLCCCVGAFIFGYSRFKGNQTFWAAIHDATGFPLSGMLVFFPITSLVFAGCVGLGIIAHENRNRVLTVAGYALLAGYWALMADALWDLDL